MLQGTFAASAIATYKLHSVQWNKVQTQMVDKKDRTRILECCIMRPHEITVPASWVHSWPEQKVTTPCICSNSDKRGSGTSMEYLRKMEKETHILSFTWTQRAVDTCMNRNAGNGTWQYVIKSKKIHNNYTCLQDICLHRLVVRTSRCGRDNPGSTPGGDISHILAHGASHTLHLEIPQRLESLEQFHVRLFQCLIQVRVSTKNGLWKLGLGFLKLRGFLFWTRIITYILN